MSEFKIHLTTTLITLAIFLAILGGVVALTLAKSTVFKMSPAVLAGVAAATARARRRQEEAKAKSRR